MRSISVVHLITGLGTGGAETMLYKLLSRTDAIRFRSTIVSLMPCSGLVLTSAIQSLGVPVHSAGMTPGLNALWKFRRVYSLVRSAAPDILMGWEVHGNVFAQLTGSLLRTNVVWNVRGSLDRIQTEKRRTQWLIRGLAAVSRLPCRIVYNSRVSALQHQAAGYHPDAAMVIPNGFDCSRFRPDSKARSAVRRELGLPEGRMVVGMVARSHPVKDHSNLLLAIALASRTIPVSAVLAGCGVDASNRQLLRRIAELGLEEKVILLGERTDIPRLMTAFDVLASSSLAESFTNVVGEAMASGIPCVVTDVGDSAWILGEAGIVVRAGDPEALAKALVQILSMCAKDRQQMGQRGRKRIEENFALDHVADLFAQLYQDVLEGANAGSNSVRLHAHRGPRMTIAREDS